MDVNGFMRKHRLSDADLDRMAEPYESATFERGERQGVQRLAPRRGR